MKTSSSSSSFGMIVVLFRSTGRQILNNVTEVHYLYDEGQKVAFESDIHSSGLTLPVSEVLEMEIHPADFLAPHFEAAEVTIPFKKFWIDYMKDGERLTCIFRAEDRHDAKRMFEASQGIVALKVTAI